MSRADHQLASAPRRGLRREDAAAYVGISATTFDNWIARGLMPKPKKIDGIVVWDRFQLDNYFEALPDEVSVTPNPAGRIR